MQKTTQQQTYTVITGASLGLGKAFAIECAKRGMNLILIALPHSGLPELSTDLKERYSVDVVTIEKDLCCSNSCQEVFELVKTAGWKVNTLVNNLGGGSTEFFASGDLHQYEQQIDLNVLTTVRLSYLFLPLLKKATPAYILNVSSLAAYFTVPQKGVYSASKSFVLSFSKTLREELRDSNIHVSVVCPSGMPTNPLSVQMIRSGSLITRISCMDADTVARIAVKGMLARKRVIVPGVINRFFLAIDKILPLPLKRLLLYSVMKRLKHSSHCTVASSAHPTKSAVTNTMVEPYKVL